MSMAGFDPFSSLERMLSRGVPSEGGARSLPLPVDVYRSGDAFIVEVDVPGLDSQSLDLQVERNLLSISGERPARHDADAVLCERPHARFSRQCDRPRVPPTPTCPSLPETAGSAPEAGRVWSHHRRSGGGPGDEAAHRSGSRPADRREQRPPSPRCATTVIGRASVGALRSAGR